MSTLWRAPPAINYRFNSAPLPADAGTIDFEARDPAARGLAVVRVGVDDVPACRNAASREGLALPGSASLRLDAGIWSLRHSIQARRAQADLAGTVTGRLLGRAGPCVHDRRPVRVRVVGSSARCAP